jgi:phosphoglycolate phosphatase
MSRSSKKFSRINHLLWDWNGTLLDDVEFSVNGFNHLLSQYGLEGRASVQRFQERVDGTLVEFYESFGLYPRTHHPEAYNHFMSFTVNNRHKTRLRGGAAETLDRVLGIGIAQHVYSAFPHDILVDLVTHHGIFEKFKSVRGLFNLEGSGKMELGREIMVSHSIQQHECLLISDTASDARVAKLMGIECVLIRDGHDNLARLQATGFPVIETVAEVLEFLEDSNAAVNQNVPG